MDIRQSFSRPGSVLESTRPSKQRDREVERAARKSDRNAKKSHPVSKSSSGAYSVSRPVDANFSTVYDVIQLDRQTGQHSASAVNSNVAIAGPCEKHPPEYFAQLLHEKQHQKSKLNQLWPKHWGCKILIFKFLHSYLLLWFCIFLRCRIFSVVFHSRVPIVLSVLTD